MIVIQQYKTKGIQRVLAAMTIVSAALVVGFIISLFTTHRAYAINNDNANIPLQVQFIAGLECGSTNNAVAQVQWLSLPGQPLVQSAVGQSGAVIPLQWNIAVFYCDDGLVPTTGKPDLTLATNYLVVGVTDTLGSDFNSLVGQQLAVNYDHANLWSQNQLTFNYVVPVIPAGIPAGFPVVDTVTESNKDINHFNTTNPTTEFSCVGTPPGQGATFNLNRGRIDNFTTPNVCPNGNALMDFNITILPPTVTACQGAVFTPDPPDVGTPFGVTINVAVSGVAPTQAKGYTLNVQVTGSGVGNGIRSDVPYSYNGATVSATINGLGPPQTAGQQVSVAWQFIGPKGVVLASCGGSSGPGGPPGGPGPSRTVVTKPYMKVYGGDVSAGGGFADASGACTSNANAKIIGWNQNTGPSFFGAGSEFSAQALSDIKRFATEQGGGNGASLSFANTANNDPTNGSYGGDFSGVSCTHDFFDDKPAGISDSASSLSCNEILSGDPAPNAAMWSIGDLGAYIATHGNATNYYFDVSGNCPGPNGVPGLWIDQSTIEPGERVNVYVKGNVLIDAGVNTGAITYDSSGWTIGTIPSLRLIVQGSIYINTNAAVLDGVYVAQPPPGGGDVSGKPSGNIYDCTSDQFTPDSTDTQFNQLCSAEQLVVNGAFIAKSFKPMRTRGTVGLSGSDPLSAGSCMDSPPPCSDAGEVFNYTPETWLSNLVPDTNGQFQYDSITSLPPVL